MRWRVVRQYRGRERTMFEGAELRARTIYQRERRRIRAGSVRLMDGDGNRVEFTEAGHNRTRW